MKRFLPRIILAIAAGSIAASWMPPKTTKDNFDFNRFGEIPVLVGGRGKPLDTVARNSLLIIHGKQELRLAALAVISLSTVKVFLLDMEALVGNTLQRIFVECDDDKMEEIRARVDSVVTDAETSAKLTPRPWSMEVSQVMACGPPITQ